MININWITDMFKCLDVYASIRTDSGYKHTRYTHKFVIGIEFLVPDRKYKHRYLK